MLEKPQVHIKSKGIINTLQFVCKYSETLAI